jgi:D-sedoheptulose 7-phosphate isomerase
MTDPVSFVAGYRTRLIDCLSALDEQRIAEAIDVLERAWTHDRLVLLAGNGGSAATAEHMDLDLSKTIARLAGAGQGFRTIALTHSGALSAWANDVGVEEMFAGQVKDLARRDDVLVVFSAMGNSPNVVRAAEEGRAQGLRTIGFLGAGGGKLRSLVDVPVVVESDDYGVIEDAHLTLNHMVTEYFGEWVKGRERSA